MSLSEIEEKTEISAIDRPKSGLRRFRNRLRAYLVSTCCISVILGTIFYRPLFLENLSEVDSRVIRSAQPTANLDNWIHTYRLASILNLRGGTPADSWYVDEVNTAKANKIAFFDYPMLATRRPLRRDLLTIIDFLKSSPFPLLIHCKHGADRTGLAVAMYRMVCLNEPPQKALDAFSVHFGHIPIWGPEKLHEPIDEYAAWLKEQSLPHTPERFREWVRDLYQSDDPPKDPRPLEPGPRPLDR